MLKDFCECLCQQSGATGICKISRLTPEIRQHLILLLSSLTPYFFSACLFFQPSKCEHPIAQLLLQKILFSSHPIIKWSEYSPILQNVNSLLLLGVCKPTSFTFHDTAQPKECLRTVRKRRADVGKPCFRAYFDLEHERS